MPQVQRTDKTDALLKHPSILLWVSQNPIYKHEKYMAFPYGFQHYSLDQYVDFLKSCTMNKDTKLINQHAGVSPSLPETSIRRVFDIFGKNSGERLEYNDYLNNIARTEFVSSTSGDRDDC